VRTVVACAIVALVVGAGSAFGASQLLITSSSQIKDGVIRNADIHKGTISSSRLSASVRKKVAAAGSQGPKGDTGPKGQKGDKGDKGDKGPGFVDSKWGVIGRNTYGSPVAQLRLGPWKADGSGPPRGKGSLGIEVSGPGETGHPGPGEKLNYGNQLDFANVAPTSLATLSYWIFADEDSLTNHNAPSLDVEVTNPTGTVTYTTLVYIPAISQIGVWHKEDASGASSQWWSTHALTAGTACTQASYCNWSTMKSQITGGNAKILSVGITKGRDNPFVGAVDAVQVNDKVYDFEQEGVSAVTP
jgi:hypothetical protein